MKESQKVALRQSEVRQRLNELGAVAEPSADQVTEIDNLTAEYSKLEVRSRALLVGESGGKADGKADGDGDDKGDGDGTETRAAEDGAELDQEERERLELRSKARLGRWFESAIKGKPLGDGAEAEVAAAYGCDTGSVPLEMFEPDPRDRRLEERAKTPAPATVNRNLAGIVPAIFDRSAAAWLGIDMPTVGTGDAGYPVLSTSVTGGPKAQSAAAAETAGAFTVTVAQPRRVTGAFRFTREDAARLVGMEEALRMNLSSVLSDAVDNQAINGSGAGDGTINGLLAILTAPSAPEAQPETFARYVAAAASHVDGLFAVDLMGLRQLVGVKTYGHAAGVFRANEDSMTAEGWLSTRTGGVRTSRRIPEPASNVQSAIVRRANPAGDRVAVMPVWGSIDLIRDEFTSASKGEVVVTGLMLVGDVVLLRAGCFVQDSYRVA